MGIARCNRCRTAVSFFVRIRLCVFFCIYLHFQCIFAVCTNVFLLLHTKVISIAIFNVHCIDCIDQTFGSVCNSDNEHKNIITLWLFAYEYCDLSGVFCC